MTEAWRQEIAKAEILLSEGEAAEDIAGKRILLKN